MKEAISELAELTTLVRNLYLRSALSIFLIFLLAIFEIRTKP